LVLPLFSHEDTMIRAFSNPSAGQEPDYVGSSRKLPAKIPAA
jgi:hypothetical protein